MLVKTCGLAAFASSGTNNGRRNRFFWRDCKELAMYSASAISGIGPLRFIPDNNEEVAAIERGKKRRNVLFQPCVGISERAVMPVVLVTRNDQPEVWQRAGRDVRGELFEGHEVLLLRSAVPNV